MSLWSSLRYCFSICLKRRKNTKRTFRTVGRESKPEPSERITNQSINRDVSSSKCKVKYTFILGLRNANRNFRRNHVI
jgi:hypothetical protein